MAEEKKSSWGTMMNTVNAFTSGTRVKSATEALQKAEDMVQHQITNTQNEDNTQKQNQDAIDEVETYYQTIAEEFDAGKITDESIKAACAKQNPPVDPTSILEYVHMTNLEREESSYYKTDRSEQETIGTEYNGTLEDGETIEVAGCTITAKDYTRSADIADAITNAQKNVDVFGWQPAVLERIRQAESDENWVDAAQEWFFNSGSEGDNAYEKAMEEGLVGKTRTLYHCSSPYLGEFDYDPTMFQIGYKEIEEKDGTKSQLPVLEYIGPDLDIIKEAAFSDTDAGSYTELRSGEAQRRMATNIAKTLIPKGCKVLDYTFVGTRGPGGANGYNLEFLPEIPEGVTSIHCAFKNCDEMESIPVLIGDDLDYDKMMSSRKNVLPSTLECASSAFKGCSKLNGSFVSRSEDGKEIDQLPKGIVNTVDMFSGCEGLDEVYKEGYNTGGGVVRFWYDGKSKTAATFDRAKFGGNLTPYLAPDLMRGIYDDISDSTVMARDGDVKTGYYKNDNVDTVIQADGSLKVDGAVKGLDESKLNQSRSAQVILAEGKVDSAHVDTSVEVASGGMRTNNKVKEADGSYTYDATGRKKSYQDEVPDSSQPWEKLAMASAIGIGAFAVGKGTTKSGIVGLLGGLGAGVLSYSTFLPNTLYPVVSKTSEILGIKKLQEWADKLPGAAAYKKNQEIRAYNKQLGEENAKWDNDYNRGNANYDERMSVVFGNATTQARTSMLVDKTCAESMFHNGKAASQEMDYAGLAMDGETHANCVTDTMQTAITAAETRFNEKYGTSLTDEGKKEMSDYYVMLMQSLESYSKGSAEGIAFYDASSPERAVLQTDGLGMVNRAYTVTAMDSLVKMNEKYHFMDETSWNKITSLQIEGVDTANLNNYKDDMYFAKAKTQAAGKTVEDIKALVAVDKDFKKAMGSRMKDLDKRIPEGYVPEPKETAPSMEEAYKSSADTVSTPAEAKKAVSEAETKQNVTVTAAPETKTEAKTEAGQSEDKDKRAAQRNAAMSVTVEESEAEKLDDLQRS